MSGFDILDEAQSFGNSALSRYFLPLEDAGLPVNRALEALYTLSRDLNAAASFEEVLHASTHGLSSALGDVTATLWLWDATCKALQLSGSYPVSAVDIAATNAVIQANYQRKTSPIYQAFDGHAPMFVEGADLSSLLIGKWPAKHAIGHALPLERHGEYLGVLVLLRAEPFADVEPETFLRLTEMMASQIATSISQSSMQEDLAEKAEQFYIVNTYFEKVIHDLRELDRIKTNFLNAVSHELRTPLATIRGYAELFEDGALGEISDSQTSYIQHIETAAIHLGNLVDDLLDFASLSAGKFRLDIRRVAYGNLVQDAVEHLRVMSDRKQQLLALELPSSLPRLDIDPLRITQVLNNLLSNAIKYTPAEGQISVRVMERGSVIRTEVQDTGIGIALEHRDSLFTSFYRIDNGLTRESSGTGLGLAISKGFIDAHNGRIGFESEPGQGSTFWFELDTAKLR